MENLKQQMTPTLAVGLAALFLIVCFMVFDSFSRWNEVLLTKVSDQKLQISQMNALSDAPTQEGINRRMRTALETLKSRMLQENTPGLNSASFQQEVRQTLQSCGAQNISVLMSLSEESQFPGITVYESSVRARDLESRLAVCLDAISRMKVAGKVTYIRWSSSGALQMDLHGFSAEQN